MKDEGGKGKTAVGYFTLPKSIDAQTSKKRDKDCTSVGPGPATKQAGHATDGRVGVQGGPLIRLAYAPHRGTIRLSKLRGNASCRLADTGRAESNVFFQRPGGK